MQILFHERVSYQDGRHSVCEIEHQIANENGELPDFLYRLIQKIILVHRIRLIDLVNFKRKLTIRKYLIIIFFGKKMRRAVKKNLTFIFCNYIHILIPKKKNSIYSSGKNGKYPHYFPLFFVLCNNMGKISAPSKLPGLSI